MNSGEESNRRTRSELIVYKIRSRIRSSSGKAVAETGGVQVI